MFVYRPTEPRLLDYCNAGRSPVTSLPIIIRHGSPPANHVTSAQGRRLKYAAELRRSRNLGPAFGPRGSHSHRATSHGFLSVRLSVTQAHVFVLLATVCYGRQFFATDGRTDERTESSVIFQNYFHVEISGKWDFLEIKTSGQSNLT